MENNTFFLQIYIEIHPKNCRSYGLDKNFTLKCDLDLGATKMNVSNGTSTDDGEQLFKTILKSIQNYRSYDPDKFGWTHAHAKDAHTYTKLSL